MSRVQCSYGRLTSAYGESFAYDAANRMTSGGKSYSGSRPYHAVKSSGYGSHSYDANGNLTGAGSAASFVWNGENRLSSATKNGVTESYTYDADGNRIKKVSGGVTTRTFFPGVYEEEQVGTGTPMPIKHYSFNGMAIATRDNGTLRYVHADHLGSSSVETSSSGTQTASRNYYAYGSTRSSSGTLQTDRTFTGQKSDGTGLLYYNARYYDPALGTFLSPDTLVPDAGRVVDYNRFLYVRGNPLKFSDPSGHCALLDDGSRSAEDAECWKAADDIYNLWPGGEDWWSGLFRMDRDSWMEIIGGNPGTDAAYMQGHLDNYWRDFYRGTGVHHEKYNPAPVMNPMPPQRELWLPGSQLVTTVGRDVYACTHSVTDCGNALDDTSTALAATAMECAVAGFGPCAGAAATLSTGTSVAGTFLGGWNLLIENGKTSAADVGYSLTTTILGQMRESARANRSVGFGISFLQWLWSHQEATQ